MHKSTCFQWEFYDPQMSGSIDGTDLIPHDKAIIRAIKSLMSQSIRAFISTFRGINNKYLFYFIHSIQKILI
ncbi:unnamed protein product [Rotaria sp. Silwood2]|nr:unnamed protein product [Rotaria sp. Silwood2]